MKEIERRDFLRVAGGAAVTASTLSAAVLPVRDPIDRPIRIGIYGTQHGHLRGKLKAMRDSSDYEIVGIYEPVPEAEARLKNDESYAPLLEGLRWVSEDALLGDASIDAVVVECRVHESIPWGRKVIDAGKHLHLEKPPGDTMQPFKDLVEDARRKDLALQMGYVFRFHEGIGKAIEAAHQGWLGDVYMMRGTINTSLGEDSRRNNARYKGGIMFELGGHQIDRAVELFGRPNHVKSWLRHDTSFQDSLADNTLAVLEYDSALAVITVCARMPNHTRHRSFEVIGTDGQIMIQPISPGTEMIVNMRVDRGPYKQGWNTISIPQQHRYIGDMKEFSRALKTGTSLKQDYDYELALHETILRASQML